MLTRLKNLLSCPAALFAAVIGVSVFSLAAAFTAEAVYGLEPCVLCIYQRWPFALAVLFGIAGLVLKDKPKAAAGLLGLTTLTFLANSAIALYHTGVERHWWRSAVEGCAVPDLSGNPQSLLENIMSAPSAPCDEIPWADPVFGLSMANYNVMLCFGLAALCLAGAITVTRRRSSSPA